MDLPFVEYQKLTLQERVALLLDDSLPENVSLHIRARILPLFPKDRLQGQFHFVSFLINN